ncbi:Fe-S cluster assembly protein SufD [Limnofasciculus baicalensis]|uniref:Fe-S cluster assembly protein SufD n=1 Tax=Limnofasciculus baicalensis BBK-W-15 TaxID=2699891 RepID=A0AAE3GU00_9CYAN|nr:Fe-S cluster assembly protein SufD [Limnofasciculus baicalensis]MCP2730685.1 Fe-S cluster assembly protein SufD [Limnofasciculus baicalensis BBK-W-15]
MNLQVSVKPEISYFSTLLGECVKAAPIENNQLLELRNHAAAIAQEFAIPTRRDEEWRFTDLSSLLKVSFDGIGVAEIPEFDIAPLILPEAIDSRLVFVNGVYAPHLSSVSNLPEGIYVGNLAGLPAPYSTKIWNYLAKQQGDSEVFTALNTAGLTDIAIVWVSKNNIVETPIHLLFISTTQEVPFICQPRVLVVAESASQVTLVEHYAANVEGCSDIPLNHPYFTNQVTEIWLEENAIVNHTRNQREAGDGFHIGKTAVSQARNSRYTCNAISLGAKLSRHNLEIWQTGEATETILNGLTMVGGEQLADTHSSVMLNHPHGITNQLHKCIVGDRGHGIFSGKVFVPKAAQFTNAGQLNRNLLLSPKARVDTKPQLEITADQVKCSHGATVSQLDAEEVFYLQSRGLKEADARNLLIDAFVAEILNRIPIPSLRQRLSQCTNCRTS